MPNGLKMTVETSDALIIVEKPHHSRVDAGIYPVELTIVDDQNVRKRLRLKEDEIDVLVGMIRGY